MDHAMGERSRHLPSEIPGQAEDNNILRPWQVFGLMDGQVHAKAVEPACLLFAASRPARASA